MDEQDTQDFGSRSEVLLRSVFESFVAGCTLIFLPIIFLPLAFQISKFNGRKMTGRKMSGEN
jgi:hypothetical protein